MGAHWLLLFFSRRISPRMASAGTAILVGGVGGTEAGRAPQSLASIEDRVAKGTRPYHRCPSILMPSEFVYPIG